MAEEEKHAATEPAEDDDEDGTVLLRTQEWERYEDPAIAADYKFTGERVRVGAPLEKPGEPTRPGPSWMTGDDPNWCTWGAARPRLGARVERSIRHL